MKSFKDTSPNKESITILGEWGGRRSVASQAKVIRMEIGTLAQVLTLSPDTTIVLDANSQGMYTISSWYSTALPIPKPRNDSVGMKGKHLRRNPPGSEKVHAPLHHDCAACREPHWSDY